MLAATHLSTPRVTPLRAATNGGGPAAAAGAVAAVAGACAQLPPEPDKPSAVALMSALSDEQFDAMRSTMNKESRELFEGLRRKLLQQHQEQQQPPQQPPPQQRH